MTKSNSSRIQSLFLPIVERKLVVVDHLDLRAGGQVHLQHLLLLLLLSIREGNQARGLLWHQVHHPAPFLDSHDEEDEEDEGGDKGEDAPLPQPDLDRCLRATVLA